MTRETRQVFEEHLDNADHGRIEKDIAENFAQDCVLLTTMLKMVPTVSWCAMAGSGS